MHIKRPKYGRLAIAIGALVIQIIFTVILYVDLPVRLNTLSGKSSTLRDEQLMLAFPIFVGILIVLGLFGDADQQCCDLPILADVVPSNIRGFAYSLVDMVNCFFAFLATVFVGILAEDAFGFIHDKNKPIMGWSVNTRTVNTSALGTALLTVNLIAMVGSLILYVLMLYTYPKDLNEMKRIRDLEKEKDRNRNEQEVSLLSKR